MPILSLVSCTMLCYAIFCFVSAIVCFAIQNYVFSILLLIYLCLGVFAWWFRDSGVPFQMLRDWSNIPEGSILTAFKANRPVAQSIVLTTVVLIGWQLAQCCHALLINIYVMLCI